MKVDFLEQLMTSDSREDVGDRQQHFEIALAQERGNENPYFVGETGARVWLESPSFSHDLRNKLAGTLTTRT